MFSEISKKKLKNGGFSLIELIIVVAIMVALVAVISPGYVRYVKKSRDVVITQAAEDILTLVKAEYGFNLNGEGSIKIYADENETLNIEFDKGDNTLVYADDAGNVVGENGEEAFVDACGIQKEKKCKSTMVYYIHISNGGNISAHPELVIEEESTYVEKT